MICLHTVLFGQCNQVNATDELGIGLLSYNNEKRSAPIIRIYNDAELTNQLYRWRVLDQEAPFCPKYLPENGPVKIIVLDTLENAYQVLINKKELKLIPGNSDYIFKSWMEYLMTSFGIKLIQTESQSIKKAPEDQTEEVTFEWQRTTYWCVLDFKGDWIKWKSGTDLNIEVLEG